MTLSQSVSEVLRDHVVLESECIDRVYLNISCHSCSAWVA
jgi:hypothetical protein